MSNYMKLFAECGRLAIRSSGQIKNGDVAHVLALSKTYLQDATSFSKGERFVLAGICLLWCDAYQGRMPRTLFHDMHEQLGRYVKMAGGMAADREEMEAKQRLARQAEMFGGS